MNFNISTGQTFLDATDTYTWAPVKIGAGGWVTGIDMHKDGNVIYCRADVGGAYRLDKGSDTWIQLVDTSSVPDLKLWDSHEYGVQSIVSAPSDESIVYMVFANGNFYQSENKGDTWATTSLNTYVEANGTARCQGERIAVDPIDSDIIYYGSHRDGLNRSFDGGTTWEVVEQVPAGDNQEYGIGTVVFDPNGGTQDGKTQIIYVTVHETGVFRSIDGGATWSNISDGYVSEGQFEDAEVGPDGAYYTILGNKKEAWKLKDGSWTLIHTGSSDQLRDVIIDPLDSNRVFLTDYAGVSNRSLDGGITWEKLSRDREERTDIPWLAKTEVGWFSFGEIIFDTQIPDKLWICQGIGVWTTTDIEDENITWTSVSMGIEELVSNDIISPPGGRPIAAFWDRAIFKIHDPLEYPSNHYPTLDFDSGWDLAYSPLKPWFIAATVADHRGCCKNNVTSYSEDRGKTWKLFKNLPSDGKHGNIAISANDINIMVLLPGDGVMPYYTTNRGATWIQTELPGTSTGGHAWYSSGQDILTSDAVDPLTFYIYHEDKGIYRSTDGGATWTLVNSTVPLGATKKVKLRSVPGKSKHLILACGLDIRKPLYRSKNGGESWDEFPGTQAAMMATLGKEAEGASYPAIYFYGTVDQVRGMWRSVDEGSTWEKIGDYPLGITARLNAFEADKNHFGVIYAGFPGNGLAYGYDINFPPDFSIPEEEITGPVGLESEDIKDKHSFSLSQNYPNPFESTTNIQYEIPESEFVTLKVIDASGKEVINMENGFQAAGKHVVEIDMQGLQKGIYLCRIFTETFSDTKKIIFK